ncbi:MAG: 50S ribosomal protein L19e [archaeon]
MASRIQKRMAASLLKVSPKRIKFDQEALEDIREAITKADVRGLIKDKGIIRLQKKGIARKAPRKRSGHGSRKGKASARERPKDVWMARARAQRGMIKEFREKEILSRKDFQSLYRKIKGGYFRSRRHIKLFMEEHNMFISKAK